MANALARKAYGDEIVDGQGPPPAACAIFFVAGLLAWASEKLRGKKSN